MGAQGTVILDFGAFPGKSDTSVNVTGQAGIVSGSLVQGELRLEATADHSADEHLVETIKVSAGNIVPGTGFTVYGLNTSQLNEPLEGSFKDKDRTSPTYPRPNIAPDTGGKGTLIYGQWTAFWVWN